MIIAASELFAFTCHDFRHQSIANWISDSQVNRWC